LHVNVIYLRSTGKVYDRHLFFRPQQEVLHIPIQHIPEIIGTPNNRAHASIIGDKTDEEIRIKLASASLWAIEPKMG
jgi:hypothetical protein